MAISDLILWCDLETTGTDEEVDDILEAAFVLTGPDLATIAEYQRVYRTSLDESQVSQVVLDMHRANGLWVEAHHPSTRLADSGDAEDAILGWLGLWLPKGDVIALGGSGVAHFDRRFIATNWPRLTKRLTYWSYDVGSVRRLARLAGVQPDAAPDKAHRAMDDIRMHLDEARWYRDMLRGSQEQREALATCHWCAAQADYKESTTEEWPEHDPCCKWLRAQPATGGTR